MAHYGSKIVVKRKLRIAQTDNSLDNEINIFIDDVDDYINEQLRHRLGFTDSVGNDVTIPLTAITTPKLDDKIRQIANDFAVAKFRFEVDNDDKLLQEAYKRLDHYLDHKYGWVSDSFRVTTKVTLSAYTGASSSSITITGENFRKNRILIVYFDSIEQTTTPAQVITHTDGTFPSSGTVTLTIPSGTAVGAYEVKVVDGATDDPDLQSQLTSGTPKGVDGATDDPDLQSQLTSGTPKGANIISGASARFTVTS